MRTWYRLVCIIILAGVASATTFTAQAQSNQGPVVQRGKDVVAKVISRAEQRAARAFWTREQIAAAPALEMPADSGSAGADVEALDEVVVTGAPGRLLAGTAALGADAAAQAAYPDDWKVLEANSAEVAVDETSDFDIAGTSQVYTSYVVNKASGVQTHYPHRWMGRLSFSVPGGTSYCSGTAISGNVMVTAAHCVYDTTNNRWHSNWVFAPAYRNGSVPYGTFAATTCWVMTSWVDQPGYSINGAARHDVAVCKMGTNSAGTTLNNAVGWAGRQWNQPYVRHFHTLGYPFRDYNTNLLTDAGLYLRTCAAESFQQTTETRGMGCNWGGGISGGPWMAGYAQGSVAGWVDGVNSGIFVGTRNLYGARFNDFNIVPLCGAAGC